VVLQLRSLGYFAGGGCADGAESVLKPVAAIPGDTVTLDVAGLAVNGRRLQNTRQLERDAQGQRLPRVSTGTYLVAPGQLWLVSDFNPDSLDARYFGPVPDTDVIAVVHPVWVRPQ
jgi:conjugative transfer signal peptidase TraF